MNRYVTYILITAISLFCTGCQKSEMQVLRSLPSEVRFTNVDLTGAHSLAVMQTMDGKVVTRSYSEPAYRLCVMDAEGKAQIASLTLRTVGNESNSAWQKIKKSLTLVPEKIVPISDDYLHLDGVMAVHDENLSEITYGAAEYEAISGYLSRLWGGYILRISDGALFKSPIPYISMDKSSVRRNIQVTPDGKTFIAVNPNNGIDLQNPVYSPILISDQGASLKVISSPSVILGMYADNIIVWASENHRFVVFNNYNTQMGAWSFDSNLQPLFFDYSPQLSPLVNKSRFMFTYKGGCYIMDWEKNSDWEQENIPSHSVHLSQITINGNVLDCSAFVSTQCYMEYEPSYSFETQTIETDESILFVDGSGSVHIEFGSSPSITLRKHPGHYSEFDSNGMAYTPGIDTIVAYNVFTGTETQIPVQWDKTSVGRLVTAELNNTSGDYYTVKGRTREAVEVIVLIEKATGLVTITNLTEFGQPIITTSYRLN